MNRLLNTSSMTGSALVPIAAVRLSLHDARQHQMVLRRERGLPAGLDHDGLVRLDDDRRAFDLVAGRKLIAGIDGGLVPFAGGEELRAARRARGVSPRVVALFFSLNLAPPPIASTDTASITRSFLRSMKPNCALCAFSKARLHRGERARLHHQRGVGAGVADMRAHEHLDGFRRHALAGDLVASPSLPRRLADRCSATPSAFAPNGFLDRLLARGADVGKAHAVGREQRRERMDQHRGHAERVGDEAGMLAAGAAEAVERIARSRHSRAAPKSS